MYILASDYDGTLSRGGISPEDRKAVEEFRKAGNLFGIVTGRDYWMYQTVQEAGFSLDFILAMNGAMLVATDGPRTGEILSCEEKPNDGCIRWIARHVGEKYGYGVDTVLIRDRISFHGAKPEGDGEHYKPLAFADTIPAFSQMNTRCRTSEDARRCVEEINRAWGGTVNALQNGVCIDIPPAGIDKGEGVARYAAKMGVGEDKVYCAGDNMNDYAMIARFHGLAVEDAVPELKAAAERSFPSVGKMIEYIMGK